MVLVFTEPTLFSSPKPPFFLPFFSVLLFPTCHCHFSAAIVLSVLFETLTQHIIYLVQELFLNTSQALHTLSDSALGRQSFALTTGTTVPFVP